MERQLEECRWLYNHLLAERRDAWEHRQESVQLYDQHATLLALKAEHPSLAGVQSQVLQNVAVRIDLAFKAFLRRCAAGEAPGYPRFRGTGRYDSLTFPQVSVGCKLDVEAKRLRVMNVGQVKIGLHRPLEGTPRPPQFGEAAPVSGVFRSPVSAPSPLRCRRPDSRWALTWA